MPLTVLSPMVCVGPVESTTMAPETVSIDVLRISPVAAMSPETLLAPSVPTSSRICTSPETALTAMSPSRPSPMMSPETVFSRVSPWIPETRALALTTPRFTATARGTTTLISAFGPPAPKLRNTSRKLSQRSCGWSISTASSFASMRRSLRVTPCTSMRAPGSSWAMTSI